MPAKEKTFDDCLAALSEDKRAALEKLRKAIRAAAPKAEECVSYGLAAFRLDGKPLVGMGATAKHCAFYLMSGSMVEAHQEELKGYDTSKGTIRFAVDRPLPASLVKKLVMARIAENAGLGGKADVKSAEVVVAWLKSHADQKVRDGMARFAIPSDNAFGIAVGDLRRYAKTLGRNHDLALALWETGWYEARILATFVDDPACVTPEQMDRWCRDFDNWGICDTACFHLFDRTPHAWRKVKQWSGKREEFVKRGAFALLASLALHDKKADDDPFAESLILIEKASGDERNFVKKAVNWALRAIGKRNPALHAAAVETAKRLAASEEPAARWNGKDALRDLASPATTKRLSRRTS